MKAKTMTGSQPENPDKKASAVTPEQFFKSRFIKLMKDLGQNASKDPETIWLIGSLAGSIMHDTNKKSWADLKGSMSRQDYSSLLSAFQAQGNELAEKGNHKAAYAVEALAISVIAPTMAKDEHIASGNKLLDRMIDDAVKFYRQNPATRKDVN